MEISLAPTKLTASVKAAPKLPVLLLNTKYLLAKYANVIAINMAITLQIFLSMVVKLLSRKKVIILTKVVHPPARR
jgi:hypothetical protein